MKRLCRVDCTWSPGLAYAVGIITSDGSLSSDGRHLNITSKDYEMVITVKSILHLTNVIGTKARGGETEKKYFVLQFGDKNFYEFLLSIGLTPNKSKTLGPLTIPKEYFFHFLRGCIDGDGSISGFSHPESSLFQLRLNISSASPKFLLWIKESIQTYMKIQGGWISTKRNEEVGHYCLMQKEIPSFSYKQYTKTKTSIFSKESIQSLSSTLRE